MSEPRSLLSDALPSDFLRRARGRLAICAGVLSVVWGLYLILFLTIWAHEASRFAQVVAICTIVSSLGLVAFTRWRDADDRTVIQLGLVYQVLVCFSVSLVDFYVASATAVPDQVSWVCVVILFFPMLVPTAPRVTGATSFCCVAMAPLALLIANQARPEPMDDARVIAAWILPEVICALCALVPATVITRLGTGLKEARRVGSYELVERLGEGGQGEVWRARHKLLARPAAVKLIRPEQEHAATTRARFEREAQITASLESPHTIGLYDFGVAEDGTFYYVMELLRGVDLESLVERFGPMPPERVVHVILQACESLHEAHERGLVHRDVKPANLYLAKRAQHYDFLKVLDFGLVRVESPRAEDAVETQERAIVGTPGYLAPEVALGEAEVGPEADLYALGCVMYFLLTGELVFRGESAMKVVVQHLTDEPPAPSERTERPIPPALEALVLRTLSKEPAERPRSARELADALRACEVDAWTPGQARDWWRAQIPEVDNPNSVGVSRSEQPTTFLRPVDKK